MMRVEPRGKARLVLAGFAVTAVTATGCTGGSTAISPPPLPPKSAVSAGYAHREHARTRHATAFAHRIAAYVPRVAGERPLANPPQALAKPDETIGVAGLIIESRYWSVPGSPLQVYRAMKRSPAARYRLTGYGRPRPDSDADPPGSAFLSYADVPAPAYLQVAEVHVEIAPYAAGSVIASFAEVAARPIRRAIEQITTHGSSATYTWPHVEHGKVVGQTRGVVAPALLPTLIREFDRSPVVASPDACFGAFHVAGDDVTVRITSGGDVLTLVYPGTSCDDIAVRRDGQPLAAIAPNARLHGLLRVLLHADGVVVGRLLEVGGPPGATPSPEPGKVKLRAGGHTVSTVHPGRSGHFTIEAPPGRYTLSGSTAHYRIDGRRGRCVAGHRVRLVSGRTVHANVSCARR